MRRGESVAIRRLDAILMMMGRKAVAAVLGGALTLGSFLCLGMGMDMGTAWAPQESHDCCPDRQPERPSDSNCCLLLPGAVSAPVVLPPTVQLAFTLPASSAAALATSERRSVLLHGPPGDLSPGHAAPSAPRAPPVA